MRHINKALIAVGAALVLSGCGDPTGARSASERQEQQATAFATSQDGRVFKSAYFNLSVEKPESWTASDKEAADRLLNVGADAVAGDNKVLQEQIDSGVQRSLTVFMHSKYPVESMRADNASVSAVAENVRMVSGVATGGDYFDQMKLLAAGSAVPIVFADTYGTREIGGQTFDSMRASFDVPGVDLEQYYYAARHKDHVVALIATYSTPEGREEAEQLLDSMQIDW